MKKWPADRVERKPVDALVPYARNARTHSDEQVAQIADSIERYGFTMPVLMAEDGGIIAGHGRVMAAKRLGLVDVPAMTAEGWTEAERQAYRLIDNKLALNAGWDEALLRTEFAELEGLGFDLGQLGFSPPELASIRDTLATGLTDPDEAPATPAEPVATRGDLWALGRHRLLCGDNHDPSNLGVLLSSSTARLVVTSPPYNQKVNTFKPSGMQKESPAFVHRMASAYADDLPEDEYRSKQIELFSRIFDCMADDGSLFYNHKVRYRDKQILHPYEIVSRFPFNVRQEIIWNRSSSITLNAKMFVPCDERIYWLTKSERFIFNDTTEIKCQGSVWTFAAKNDLPVSAPFPVELPHRCIEAASIPGDLVFDPFLGSGTTIIATEMTGRKCCAIEIDPAYVDVAIMRWQNFTGEKAKLGAKTFEQIGKQRKKKAA